MPKYLFEAHYSADGAKGVAKEGGTRRREAIATTAESVGGKLESFYFAFGGVDAYRDNRFAGQRERSRRRPCRQSIRRRHDEDGRPAHARGNRRGQPESCRLSAAGALTLADASALPTRRPFVLGGPPQRARSSTG